MKIKYLPLALLSLFYVSATTYPEIVDYYRNHNATLYRLSPTTQRSQSAKLVFNQNRGELRVNRQGREVYFQSVGITAPLTKLKVAFICSSTPEAETPPLVVGSFMLGKNFSGQCPAIKPYVRFWVSE
jgi:hypothetical protein